MYKHVLTCINMYCTRDKIINKLKPPGCVVLNKFTHPCTNVINMLLFYYKSI